MAVRTVLITGEKCRHRYAAARLAEGLDLVGVVSETKRVTTADPDKLDDEDRRIIDRHLAERDEVETRLLGHAAFPAGVAVRLVSTGESNSAETFEWVRRCGAEAVLLYGCSIIQPPLLEAFDRRMINMHLGLSPYYRGAGTNFWPLVDRLPECVGATIHLAGVKVDAGAILTQVRPDSTTTDRAHDLGTKTIIAGLAALIEIVPRCLAGDVEPLAQDLTRGRVFRRKDFHADAVRRMWKNLDEGMMTEYVDRVEERRRAYPLVERTA